MGSHSNIGDDERLSYCSMVFVSHKRKYMESHINIRDAGKQNNCLWVFASSKEKYGKSRSILRRICCVRRPQDSF